ncbi:hypothetical protein HMN09_00499000 [Mycena chlorophos]|uniref:Extracellular membrane protein CFEM domain-containing protein n=1 Tax=Mycena chlorophos TaxID=658473 RepID=A0A8H6T9M9_MYCCL|nr:hypothetical protein HMN09_00499000 [Mycena chlorophos]
MFALWALLLFSCWQIATAANLARWQSRPMIPSVRRVFPRGLTDIPSTCSTDCAPFEPFLDGQTCPVTQCCSGAFETAYGDCFKCVGVAINATDYTLAQEYVDVVNTACAAEGYTLPVVTLPGQNPNRTLASALPADASAIAVFGGSSSAASSVGPTSSHASSGPGTTTTGTLGSTSLSATSAADSSASLQVPSSTHSGSAPTTSSPAPSNGAAVVTHSSATGLLSFLLGAFLLV